MTWKEYPRNIKVRLITSFFNRAVVSAVMPFMALFFAGEMGKVWAGAFLMVTVIISFIINLIGGYISDRFQRKKVVIWTASLSAFMFLAMTISLWPEERFIWLFAFSYTAFIITSSLGRPAIHAIIIDSTTPENRKAVYTAEYWLTNLSMAIGAALGGLLYVSHQLELFALLTLTSACLPVAYAIWLTDDQDIRLLEKQHQNVLLDVIGSYRVTFRDTPFVKVVAGSMFIFAAEFTLNSYIGVRLAETFEGVSFGSLAIDGVRMLSLLNIQNMLLVVCFTFFVSKATDGFQKQHVLLFGLILYSFGYVAITSANTWYILLAFNLLATLGELVYSPVRNAEQANMMPDDKRGSYSAFSGISFSGADMLARSSIILGAYLAPSMMSIYMGAILLVGTALVYSGLFIRKAEASEMELSEDA
jgi:MFS family permease